MTRLVLFAEASTAGLFDPLDLGRPPFLLRNGVWTVAERWIRLLDPAVTVAGVRPSLSGFVGEQTGWMVNRPAPETAEDVWLILGVPSPREYERWRPLSLPEAFVWTSGGNAVIRMTGEDWNRYRYRLNAWLESGGQGDCPCELTGHQDALPIRGAAGLWDMVSDLPNQLEFDGAMWRDVHASGHADPRRHTTTILISEDRIVCRSEVAIGPHTILDASSGPIILDTGVTIEPFTRLCGPAYVGPHSRLVGGKISGGCSLGPGCKIGGEVEASIVHGFANKVHEGFFGHGYIGEWVNLGALTTNSDLKNTYGTVRVVRSGETVDTQALKVGSYLSDHTKTGIGTLLPTGATLGMGVNIIAGGLTPKSLPSFVWGGDGVFTEHQFDRMLDVARITMGRRADIRQALGYVPEMSTAEAEVLRGVFERSAGERREFLAAHRRGGGQN